MPTVLKHEVESLDSIPEQLRSLYTEKDDGGFAIPEELRGAADAVTALYKANDNIRSENKKLQRKGEVDLSPLADFGETVDDITTAVTAKINELEEQLAAGKEGKINLDKVRAEMKEAHAKDLAEKDKAIQTMQGTVHKHLVRTAAMEAIAKANGIGELLMPHVERNVKVVEADGEFRAVVVDKDGDTRISGATGEPMTISELVGEMKANETYMPAFKSEAPGGGGTPPTQRRAPGGPQQKELSPIEKIKAGLDKGQAARRGAAA